MLRKAILLISTGFAAAGCVSAVEDPDLSAFARRDLTPKEKVFLTKVIKDSLKDPDSAMIDWLAIPAVKSQVFSYCVLVNAKNSMGGYVGRMPAELVVHASDSGEITTGQVAGISSGPDEYEMDFWKSRCQKLGYLSS